MDFGEGKRYMSGNFGENYEKRVVTRYSDLGKQDPENMDTWGNAIYEGKWLNIYNNSELINHLFTQKISEVEFTEGEDFVIADFGGAEGFVVNEVVEKLKAGGRKVAGMNIDSYQASLDLTKSKYPDIRGAEEDLLDLHVEGSSVDAGILRFTMPYIRKEKQIELLESIYRTLKPGGRLVILQDGAYSQKEGEKHNQIFAEASAAQGSKSLEEVLSNRHFPSGEAIEKMAREAGFDIIESRELEEVQSWLSVQAYVSRFEVSPEQKGNLEKVFQKWGKEASDDPQGRRIKRPMVYLVLEKKKENH